LPPLTGCRRGLFFRPLDHRGRHHQNTRR